MVPEDKSSHTAAAATALPAHHLSHERVTMREMAASVLRSLSSSALFRRSCWRRPPTLAVCQSRCSTVSGNSSRRIAHSSIGMTRVGHSTGITARAPS